MSILVRTIFLLGFVAVCSATSCIAGTAIAVAPTTESDSTAMTSIAFALVAATSEQFGLTPELSDEQQDKGFTSCFKQDHDDKRVIVCGKTKAREAQFLVYEYMETRLTPHADSLRVALLDSLRSRLGGQAVRECKWAVERDMAQSGCALRR